MQWFSGYIGLVILFQKYSHAWLTVLIITILKVGPRFTGAIPWAFRFSIKSWNRLFYLSSILFHDMEEIQEQEVREGLVAIRNNEVFNASQQWLPTIYMFPSFTIFNNIRRTVWTLTQMGQKVV